MGTTYGVRKNTRTTGTGGRRWLGMLAVVALCLPFIAGMPAAWSEESFAAIGVWADTGAIEGEGWSPNSSVTVEHNAVPTWWPTTDETGYFHVEDAGAMVGDEIVVTDDDDATRTKSMTVIDLDLQVDQAVDPDTAVVVTTSYSEEVFVFAEDTMGNSAMRVVAGPTATGGDHVDFTDEPVSGTEEAGQLAGTVVWAAANSNDGDGDGTNLVWDSSGGEEQTPSIAVWPDQDVLRIEGPWEVGRDVTFEIASDADFTDILVETTMHNDGWVELQTEGFDIQRGMWVAADDGADRAVHQVQDLFVGGYDADLDTVFGRAVPGSTVIVQAGAPDVASVRNVVAGPDEDDGHPDDGLGPWLAVFSEAGTDPGLSAAEQGVYDIGIPGSSVVTEQRQGDGETDVELHFPNPRFRVDPEADQVFGEEWPEGVTVTISVDDGAETPTQLAQETAVVYRWGDNPWEVGFDAEFGIDIVPGHVVTVTDGAITKDHTVIELVDVALDPTTAIVTGSTISWTVVQVGLGNDSEWAGREVMSDGDGWFTADLGQQVAEGEPGDGVMSTPLADGTGGDVRVPDDDGDATQHGLCVGDCGGGGEGEPPTIFASAYGFEYIEGVGWDGLEPLTVDVAGATCDVTLDADGFDDEPGHFFLAGGRLAEEGELADACDLSPGDVVTVSGADGTTKSLTISDLVVTDVDEVGDTVSGLAAGGTEVMLHVYMGDEQPPLEVPVTAAADGTWSVDLSADLVVDGPRGAAYQWDDDGDATQSDWYVANPVLIANAAQDQVILPDWPSGQDATLSVYASDAVTTLLHEQTVALPGPYFLAGEVWEDDLGRLGGDVWVDDLGGFDLQPGHWVEVATADVARAFTVSPVQVTDVDFATATVTGVIDPGASGFVGLSNDTGECEAEFADTDDNGTWSITLSTCSDGFEMGTHVEGAAGQAMVTDGDSQGMTIVFWSADHVTETVDEGGTVSSGDGTVDEGDPVETTVTAPSGTSGEVTITETTVTGEVADGFVLLGSQVTVTTNIPTSEPFELTFLLDASVIPDGEDASTITVFKDGVAVPDCADVQEGTYPCVSVRSTDATTGDVTITVLTPDFSTWTLGVPVLRFGEVSAPDAPLEAPATFDVSAPYTDRLGVDDDAVTWTLRSAADDFTADGTASGGVASGTFTDVPVGVYELEATLTDGFSGATATLAYEYVVVYDPDGGFVTGGGWFDSPAGAFAADELLEGRATFGFMAKYHKGAQVPDGNTQFEFSAGGLEFHSTSYDWLVVAGKTHAKFKGVGEVNGVGGYQFMLSVVDGDPDTFRIKIWEESTGAVVYDNGLVDESGTALGGGQVVVHVKRK